MSRKIKPISKQIIIDAFMHGQMVAWKANGCNGYNRSWEEVPKYTRKGWEAMARYVWKKAHEQQ